jgi:hypothetical protein
MSENDKHPSLSAKNWTKKFYNTGQCLKTWKQSFYTFFCLGQSFNLEILGPYSQRIIFSVTYEGAQ